VDLATLVERYLAAHAASVHVRAAARNTGFDPALDVIYTFACDEEGRIARLRAFFDLRGDAGRAPASRTEPA
jgi:hypothetical protein